MSRKEKSTCRSRKSRSCRPSCALPRGNTQSGTEDKSLGVASRKRLAPESGLSLSRLKVLCRLEFIPTFVGIMASGLRQQADEYLRSYISGGEIVCHSDPESLIRGKNLVFHPCNNTIAVTILGNKLNHFSQDLCRQKAFRNLVLTNPPSQ